MNSLSLKEIVQRLQRYAPDTSVVFDFGLFVPDRICSWRGAYEYPALVYREPNSAEHYETSVQKVLHALNLGLTERFYGYKGGHYSYNGSETLWVVADPADVGHTVVSDVTYENFEIVFHTAYRQF